MGSAECGMENTDSKEKFGMGNAECGMENTDSKEKFGMGNAECGMKNTGSLNSDRGLCRMRNVEWGIQNADSTILNFVA
jgi:hypothetical protein